MDYKELLRLQKVLDDSIHAAHKTSIEETWKERNLALIVEFSEFTNELSAFKYWKKNKEYKMEKVYEEFSDVLHFVFSYFIMQDEIDIATIKPKTYEGNAVEGFLDFFKVSSTIYCEEKGFSPKNLAESFSILMGIANAFNLDHQEIENYYKMKNKINHDRIRNNY